MGGRKTNKQTQKQKPNKQNKQKTNKQTNKNMTQLTDLSNVYRPNKELSHSR